MTATDVSRRNKAAKKRGADFEISLVKELREAGLDVERLTKAGKDDEGDIVVRLDGGYVVVEAKNEARIDIPGYLREAEVERDNFIAHRSGINPEKVRSVAIVKARGKPTLDSYVIMPLRRFFGISS